MSIKLMKFQNVSSASHPILEDVGVEDTEGFSWENWGDEIAFQKSGLKALFPLCLPEKWGGDPDSYKKGPKPLPPRGFSVASSMKPALRALMNSYYVRSQSATG